MAAHEFACITQRIGLQRARFHVYNVFQEIPRPEALNHAEGLLIGGSGKYSVHDPRTLKLITPLRKLIDKALTSETPCFGICFGHQLLAFHLGAKVATTPEKAEIGTIKLRLTEEGKKDPLFSTMRTPFMVHTGHTDQVIDIPKGVTLLAKRDFVPCQAFKVKGAPFYTTQFHPELLGQDAIDRYNFYQSEYTQTLQNSSIEAPDPKQKYIIGADDAIKLLPRFVLNFSS